MAIDSRVKRESALFFGRHHTIHPDGTINTADRQDVLGFYRGIAAAAAVIIGIKFAALGPKYKFAGREAKYQFAGRGAKYKFKAPN